MKEILAASTALGFDILSHGAETYRVEESITRMCAAYGYQNTDVFVIPSSIVVTITDDTGAYLTRTRRILSRDTDLDKVDKLNAKEKAVNLAKIKEMYPTDTPPIMYSSLKHTGRELLQQRINKVLVGDEA